MAGSKRPPLLPSQVTQRAAIEEAKEYLEAGGVIQVYGLPEVRMLGERYCTEEHQNHIVVYHTRSVALANGGFYCLACGTSSEEPDGTA